MFTSGQDFVEIDDHEGGMSALSGMKIGLDAQVQIYWPRGEPNTVAAGHRSRFFDFGEAQDAGVEVSGASLASFWDGDLNVIETKDWHRVLVLGIGRMRPARLAR